MGYNNEILVIWNGDYCIDDDTSTKEFDEESLRQDDIDNVEDDSACDSDDNTVTLPDVPHTVVFKCIGASRDSHSQLILQTARNVIASGGTVPVRMRPEPTNIFGSQAIVFECELNSKWNKIGYVVTEILDHVHAAISSSSIMAVNFRFIRYVTHWTVSGPGYYAGISVTKNGPWSGLVRHHKSTIQ